MMRYIFGIKNKSNLRMIIRDARGKERVNSQDASESLDR
jgi:hypothetical protein